MRNESGLTIPHDATGGTYWSAHAQPVICHPEVQLARGQVRIAGWKLLNNKNAGQCISIDSKRTATDIEQV
jgi:hypothetical protein